MSKRALVEALQWCEQDAQNEEGTPTQEMLDARVEVLGAALLVPDPVPALLEALRACRYEMLEAGLRCPALARATGALADAGDDV